MIDSDIKTKKELKQAYKESKSEMGVFQIRNTVNGRVLIEASADMYSKWNRHQMELKFGSHRNRELQNDWKIVGEEGFEFSIISKLEYQDKMEVDYKKELKVLLEMVISEVDENVIKY